MFSRIEYLITETFLSLRRHPAMAFAAITCVAAALYVSGMVGLAMLNVNQAVTTALNQVRFVVYFQPETSRQDAWAAYKQITQMGRVASAQFINREDAWAKVKEKDPKLVANLDRNPLPDSVVVKATDIADIPALKATIEKWPDVHLVRDAPEVSTFLSRARQGLAHLGVLVGFVLAVLSLVIIHHTIELTLYARRKEIHIMSLVGATPATVAMPFLMEGIVYGLCGGGVALGGLVLLYRFLQANMKASYGVHLLQQSPQLMQGMLVILAAGAVLGMIGSVVSVTKYLHRPRSRITNA